MKEAARLVAPQQVRSAWVVPMMASNLPHIWQRLIVVYGAAVNAVSFGLFWYDKQQARKKAWRVPEKTLCLSALAGGWVS